MFKLEKLYSNDVFCPIHLECHPYGIGTNYPRVIELRHNGKNNGTLIATCEHDCLVHLPDFPIFKSTDEGKT